MKFPTTAFARSVIGFAMLLLSYVAYAEGLRHHPQFDAAQAARLAYADHVIRTEKPADDLERRLAEIYWNRYPDVAQNAYFGRHGNLGIHGAREHYNRHGRHEGRIWGPE